MKNTKLTTKQIEILLLLYKFRFLHTYQFQKLLNHKKSNRIKVWLKDLTEKDYIKKDYTKSTMHKKPAIYSLTIKARELLKNRKECNITVLNKIYKENSRSTQFINHCMLIADIQLTLTSKITNDENLFFATKSNLLDYDYFPDPLPDAYIVIKKPKSTQRYLIDVIDANLPRFAVRGKIQRFIEYYQSDKWEEKTNTQFPSIIVISPTDESKKYTKRFINTTFEDQTEISFLITTVEELKSWEFH
jgi:DNA-binding PadR family transcriptional regulator